MYEPGLMKKTLAAFALIVIVFGVEGAALSPLFAHTARAEENVLFPTPAPVNTPAPTSAPAPDPDPTQKAREATNDLAGAALKGFEAGYNVVGPSFNSQECGPLFSQWGNCLRDFATYWAVVALQIALFLVALAGTALNFALGHLGLGMGALVKEGSAIGTVISTAWIIFRDLGNLALIAGLVWASIAMILGINAAQGQPPGKLVVYIIIVSLVINFSYFFAGVLIDASNALSGGIYKAGIIRIDDKIKATESVASVAGAFSNIGVNAGPDSGAGIGKGAEKFLDGIKLPWIKTPVAEIFLYQTKLVSILDPAYLKEMVQEHRTGTFFIMVTMAVALLGLTMQVFFTAAAMIIARFIILVVLLATSPIMVLRFTPVEPLQKWGLHWWKELTNQLVFLPVFLLLLMTSFNLINGFTDDLHLFVGANPTIAGLFAEDVTGAAGENKFEGAFRLLMLFGMAWGLLHLSIRVAKNISQGAELVLPSGAAIQKFAIGGGEAVGKFSKKLAYLPRTVATRFILKPTLGGVGKVLEGTGNILQDAGSDLWRRTGVPALRRRIGELATQPFEVLTAEGRRKQRQRQLGADKAAAAPEFLDKMRNGKTPADREEAKNSLKDFLTNPAYTKEAAKFLSKLNAKDFATVEALMGSERMDELLADAKRQGLKVGVGTRTPPDKGAAQGSGQLSAEKQTEIAQGIAEGNAQQLEELKNLEYYERQRLFVAKKEILADRENTTRIANALGRDVFGKHLGEMPLTIYRDDATRRNLAGHMTRKGYAKLVDRFWKEKEDPSVLANLEEDMRAAGTGRIIDNYIMSPRGRRREKFMNRRK